MSLAACNPAVAAVCLLSAAGIAMFCMNPVILALSLCGAVCFSLLCGRAGEGRWHLFVALLFVATALVNPLVSHRGATVLLVVNHTPLTLESLLWGISAAAAVAAALCWFRAFSRLMTGDRLLWLFGRLSPRLSLVLSMAFRFVPLFGRQAKKIRQTQRALGALREDSAAGSFRGSVRVFSVLLTWALENGIVTADSMAARGYGSGRRTQFSVFRFRRADGVLLALALLFFAGACIPLACGALDTVYYPRAALPRLTPAALTGYVSYGLLALLPAAAEGWEAIRWKCLRSSI